MVSKLKPLTIYINQSTFIYLKNKTDEGYKVSSYIRHLILKDMQKEQKSQEVASNGN